MHLNEVEVGNVLRRFYKVYCEPTHHVPILSKEDYECFFSLCIDVIRSQEIVLKEKFYWLLLLAMYKGENHGEKNHFTKIYGFFSRSCPEFCNEFKIKLEAITSNNIQTFTIDP